MRIKVPLCTIFTKGTSLRHLWSILCKAPTAFFNTNTDKNVKMKCVPQSGNDVMDEGDKCLFWGSNQRDKKSLKTHFEVIFWRMNIYFLLG